MNKLRVFFIFVFIGLIVFFVGCIERVETPVPTPTPEGKLCSNEKYSTTELGGEIVLTPNSKFVLENNDYDLTKIRDMDCLQGLYLSLTGVSDLSPLSGLTNLESLFLSANDISDISPLKNLTKLKTLDLSWNTISDISPLENLTNLEFLNLAGTNVFPEDCNSLKEKLSNTRIKCPS